MKIAKTVTCYIIVFLIALSSAGCGNNNKSYSTVAHLSSADIKGMNTWEVEEIKKAISLGIVPDEIQNNLQKAVTGKELVALLDKVIAVKKGNNSWNTDFEIQNYNNNQTVTRQSAAIIVYKAAAVGLQITQPNGAAYRYTNQNQFSDVLSNNKTLNYLSFVTGDYDLMSNARLMDVTSDGYFRINDKLTRKEAIEAAYRLSNSIVPAENYVSMDKVTTMELTKNQMTQAKKMATPTVEKLPAWHGLSLSYQIDSMNNTLFFNEQDVKNLADLGFNFVRVPLNFYNMFESEKTPDINLAQLDNLDDLIRWGIKYHVHICIDFHCLPGYQSASYSSLKNPVDDFFTNKDRQKLAADIYTMLAKHYKNVPSSALSFDLLNEPIIDPIETQEAVYTPVIEQLISAVRAADPQRFIIVDGLCNDADYAPARKPVDSLAKDHVAQSMHYYGDIDFANYAFDRDCYAPQGWPLPYVNGCLHDNNRALTISGNFPKGTNIQLSVNFEDTGGNFKLNADGVDIYSADKIGPDEDSYNKSYQTELPADARTIKVIWTGTDGSTAKLNSVVLKYPEKAKQPVPFYGSSWGSNNMTYRDDKIICFNDPVTKNTAASALTVDSNGIYSNPGQADLAFDINYMRRAVKPWVDFSKKNHVAFMVQEFGVANRTPENMSLAYLKDFLTVLKENNIPWCMWGYCNEFGIFDSRRYDVKYESYGPYLLDRNMLKLLQQFQ